MTCGIYKIENKINGKIYIGQSLNIEERWKDHRNIGFNSNNKNYNYPLYKAFRKYGIDNFNFSIVEECSQKELNIKEIYWIKYYNSYCDGYNQTMGGDGPIQYDYEEIVKLWKEGFLCKEIEEKIGCCRDVVHLALLNNNINQEDILSRGKESIKMPVVGLHGETKEPLKVFPSVYEAGSIFTNKNNQNIKKSIKEKNKAYGYYWEYLNENNMPKKEITIDEFLKYQLQTKHNSKEHNLKISLAQRKVERPSREVLKEEIRTLPLVQVAKKYGVCPSSIGRWCDFYELPKYKREINSISDEDWKLI